jgi:lipoyl(octanoyl) transferase
VRARTLGLVAYEPTWRAMRSLTAARRDDAEDEIWLVQHPGVFTLGLAARREHVRSPGSIPVVATDRGGQVTYHGPGQAIAYVMLDLRRRAIGARELVRRLEQGALDLLAGHGIAGSRREGMPGVYVDGEKIAAIGLRIARGCSYHGIALNVDCDLEPFERIDPCGYPGLRATSLAALGARATINAAQQGLSDALARSLAVP